MKTKNSRQASFSLDRSQAAVYLSLSSQGYGAVLWAARSITPSTAARRAKALLRAASYPGLHCFNDISENVVPIA